MTEHNRDALRDNQDFEYIRRRLLEDAAQIELPDSLRSENLLSLLDDLPETDDAPREEAVPVSMLRRRWIQWAACAACCVLVYMGVYHAVGRTAELQTARPTGMSESVTAQAAVNGGVSNESAPIVDAASADADAGPIVEPAAVQPVAAGYGEVAGALERFMSAEETPDVTPVNPATAGGGLRNAAPMESAAPMADSAEMGGAAGVFQTNAQVAGVDEADIVKTDGTYIYHYRLNRETGGAQIAIVGATNLKVMSTIELEDYTSAEMYLKDSRLTLIRRASERVGQAAQDQLPQLMGDVAGTGRAETAADVDVVVPDYIEHRTIASAAQPMTETLVYDVSDRQKPVEAYRFAQDGRYVTSRQSGNTVYVVSNKGLSFGTPLQLQRAAAVLPVVMQDDTASLLEPQSIIMPPYIESASYAVVTALDTQSGERSTKAVLGMAENIMMNKNSLYLTASVTGGDYSRRETGITRFSVDGTNVGYVSSGSVPGFIGNQFSLDEHNGNLRVATTSYLHGTTSNNLYVLDPAMEVIGSVVGLAPQERIYSVRFMEDTAYVVTFRETDPLFVIDLSNPKQPTVKGELKIPGFSEYLHPIDQNTLVGLGRNTVVNQYGGVMTDGIKLSLFDVTDPQKPVETASYIMGNNDSYTAALDDHRALMYYPGRRLIGFPATICTSLGGTPDDMWRYGSNVVFSGYLVVEVKEDGFELAAKLDNPPASDGFAHYDYNNSIERGIYIGETLYTCAPGRLLAYSIKDYRQIGELAYES